MSLPYTIPETWPEYLRRMWWVIPPEVRNTALAYLGDKIGHMTYAQLERIASQLKGQNPNKRQRLNPSQDSLSQGPIPANNTQIQFEIDSAGNAANLSDIDSLYSMSSTPSQFAVAGSAYANSQKMMFGEIKQKYSTQGVINATEFGGVAGTGTNECVYICHGLSTLNARQTIAMGIARYMAKRFGLDFTQTTDWVSGEWKNNGPNVANDEYTSRIIIFFRNSPEGLTGEHYIDITPAVRWYAVIDSIVSLLSTFGEAFKPELLSASYYTRIANVNNGAPTRNVYSVVAECDLYNTEISFAIQSTIILQNATPGSSGTDTDALSVSNNPVRGKYYNFPGTMVALRYEDRELNPVVYLGPQNTGVHVFNYNASGLGANAQAQLRRPPIGAVWTKSYKTGPVRIAPGGAIVSTIKREQTMKLATFLEAGTAAILTTQPEEQSIGVSQIIALEKEVRATNGGVNFKIDYELNQRYMCKLVYKPKTKWITHTVVTTT